jgi:hypothetical protein
MMRSRDCFRLGQWRGQRTRPFGSTPLSGKELDRIRASALRGRPYGGDTWVSRTVSQLHLEHTVRPEGRPKKTGETPVEK